MDITWKYKIDLTDESVFSEIEKERGIVIHDDFKKFILEANAATPSKYNYMLGTTEKVVGAILSFNRNDVDVDTVYTALGAIEDKNLLPFAIDPFGNYLCYDLKESAVVFWNHESDVVASTKKSIEEFIDSLY